MPNTYFKFKQFTINQDKTAMKVGVDGVLLGAWTEVSDAQNILDIGTGTGLLSLMLAQKSQAKITAVEIEKNAYIQAKENINQSTWSERIEIVNTSIQKFVESISKKFDLIICNPPYFSASLNSKDHHRNIARHDDGLPVHNLFEVVSQLLLDNGRFSMIYPFDRKAELVKLAEDFCLYPDKMLNVKGTELKEPNRLLVEFSFNRVSWVEVELIVRDVKINDYTFEYKQLTRDYYLKF